MSTLARGSARGTGIDSAAQAFGGRRETFTALRPGFKEAVA